MVEGTALPKIGPEVAYQTDTKSTLFDLSYRLSSLKNRKMDLLGSEARSFPTDLNEGVVEYLKSKAGPCVVDCGSGSENIGKEISAATPNSKYLNIDLYPPKTSNISRALTVQADLNHSIPIVPGSSDLSLSLYLSHYLLDPLAHMNELIRVAKPGGYIVLNGVKAVEFSKNFDELGDFHGKNIRFKYFSSANKKIDTQKLQIYVDDDWIIMKVIDSNYRLPGTINEGSSYTIRNNPNPKEIMDKAHFVYKL